VDTGDAAQKQELATKTDLANTKAELLKWFIGIAIAQFSGIAYLLVRLTGRA
jgi:hypothetical protein